MPDAACGGLSDLIPPVHSPGLSGVPHPHGPLPAAVCGQDVWHGAAVRRGDAPVIFWVEGVDQGPDRSAGDGVGLAHLSSPEAPPDGDDGELGHDNGTTDGGGHLLGSLHTKTNMAIEVTDSCKIIMLIKMRREISQSNL